MTTTAKSSKVHELEKKWKTGDQATPSTAMKTGCIVDVMANVRKMKTSNVRTFGEFCSNTLNATYCIAKCASKTYSVFDSYVEMSIKDSERQKRECDRKVTPYLILYFILIISYDVSTYIKIRDANLNLKDKEGNVVLHFRE